jgi:hypothetical protein
LTAAFSVWTFDALVAAGVLAGLAEAQDKAALSTLRYRIQSTPPHSFEFMDMLDTKFQRMFRTH